jgi:hypothetical protein
MTERRVAERTETTPKVTEKRRRLWRALNEFIRSQGGWVTSPPSGRFVRIEVEQGSSLLVQLEKAGHRVHHVGMTRRIDAGAFHVVDVLELDLSEK